MSVTVGLLHLKLQIPQASSLKDKRRAVKSFKDRMRSGHNVSVAEVGDQDVHRSALLAVAMVGGSRQYIEGGLETIRTAAANDRNMLLIDSEIEWL